jgi:hypothetical protein
MKPVHGCIAANWLTQMCSGLLSSTATSLAVMPQQRQQPRLSMCAAAAALHDSAPLMYSKKGTLSPCYVRSCSVRSTAALELYDVNFRR